MAESDDNDAWRQEAVRMQRDDPDLTTVEIAEKFDKPVKVVKNVLANARKKGALVKPEQGHKGHANQDRNETLSSSKYVPYRIAPISGKGLGLVATRKIRRGELIIEEKPVLTASEGFMRYGQRQLQKQFDELDGSVQEEIMALHDKEAPDGAGKTLLGVFSTNALPQGAGSLDGALCLTISRANHSCVSNCCHGWVDGRERLYCDADIEVGEEICTSYIAYNCTTVQRQRQLETKFGFLCECPACTEPESLRKQHDEIRLKISELDQAIPEMSTRPSKALALVEQVLLLYEKLGRPIPYAQEVRHCFDGFQLSLGNGSIPAAKRWIQRAYEANVVTDGRTAPATLKFERFMKNPKSALLGPFS